jgi:hypothetical protein
VDQPRTLQVIVSLLGDFKESSRPFSKLKSLLDIYNSLVFYWFLKLNPDVMGM